MKRWSLSYHAESMNVATQKTVLGDFNGKPLEHSGETTRFYIQDGKYWAEVKKREASSEKREEENLATRNSQLATLQIEYTLGVYPLQEYLVKFPDGKIQCLPWAWDVDGKKWFHLYAQEDVPEGDLLHWRQPAQNWNYMCASCHVTNLKRGFDFATKTYHSTFTEINNGCESCHGPGSEHVEQELRVASCKLREEKKHEANVEKREARGEKREISLATKSSLATRNSQLATLFTFRGADGQTSTDACAPCHARRVEIYPDWKPGNKFCDNYFPELLDSEAFYPDGQIKDEDFEYTSFLQSKFYAKGGSCVDCHDAFIARIQHNQQDGFKPKPVSEMCAKCHEDKKYNSPSHHFHNAKVNIAGTRCEDCHMPSVKYMAVDNRRDHSMSNPRPQLTADLGIPNACNGCHNDKSKGETAQWAQSKIDQWYGKQDYSHHFAYAIVAGREARSEKREASGENADTVTRLSQLATRNSQLEREARSEKREARKTILQLDTKSEQGDFVPDIVRASAASLLANFDSPLAKQTLLNALKDKSELVRTAATRALEYKFTDVYELKLYLEPLLTDPIRSVRMEAARQLSVVYQYDKSKSSLFDKAIAEYITSQEYLNDQPSSYLNLGVLEENWGHFTDAEHRYRQSLELDMNFYPGRNNLAMILYRQGRKTEAEKEFKTLTQTHPKDAQAWYSLGLLIAEDKTRMSEAIECLEKAVELNPNSERMRYNLEQMKQCR